MTVYFIQAGAGGPVKIGYTSDVVPSRLRDLQVGCPFPLSLVREMPGDIKLERGLHRHYAALRLRGEWFHFCETMLTVCVDDVFPIVKDVVSAAVIVGAPAKVRRQFRGPMEFIRCTILKMTQGDLAAALGVSQSSVCRWDLETSEPRLTDMAKMRGMIFALSVPWNDNWFYEIPVDTPDA